MQIADEKLKLKEMSLEMKKIDMENSTKHEPLEQRYKSSIEEIANQKQRFMLQLHEVSVLFAI